jgi:hypothetical protein
MNTRWTRGAAVGLLVVAGLLNAGRPLDASAIGGLNTVTVTAGHGKAATPFQVTYAISPCQSAAGLTITFSWGALAPAGPVLGTAATDSSCRATLSTTPPVNAAAGSYLVFGYLALPTGTPTPNTEASASYMVDVTPTPTATSRPSATSKPSASAPGNASASASAPGNASASASAPGNASASASTPGNASASASPAVAEAGPGGQPEWWKSWQFVIGSAALALALLALIAFIIVSLIRRRRARAVADFRNDRVA